MACVCETRYRAPGSRANAYPIHVKGYKSYQVNISPSGTDWGTALLIRDDLTHTFLGSSEAGAPFEWIAARVNLWGGETTTVVSVYLPQESHGAIRRAELNGVLSKFPTPVVICGDFNAHHELWNSRVDADGAAHDRGEALAGVAEDLDLVQLTKERTFIRPNVYQSTLDLAWVSSSIAVRFDAQQAREPWDSDHMPCWLSFDSGVTAKQAKKRFSTDYRALSVGLKLAFLDRHPSGDLATDAESLTKALQKAEKAGRVELLPAAKPDRLPWMTAKLFQQQLLVKLAWKLYSRGQCVKAWVAFRREVVVWTRLSRTLKRRHFRAYLSKFTWSTPLGKAWEIVKGLAGMGLPSRPHQALLLVGDRTRTYGEVVEKFADLFQEKLNPGVPTPELQASLDQLHNHQPQGDLPPLFDKPFSMSELRWAIGEAKNSAPGPDGISAGLLKALTDDALVALLQVINQSWETGKLPDTWKLAVIVLLHKEGKDPSELTSYRPISLTAVLGKIMERMVLRRLQQHTEQSSLFDSSQTGFRPGLSTQNNIQEFTLDIKEALQDGDEVAAFIADFDDAFGSPNHELLLSAVSEAGITGRAHAWLKDFLTDRSVKIRMEGETSREVPMTKGTPQGSVISPFLFNLMMRSLVTILLTLGIHFSLYADDLVIWCRGKVGKAVAKLQPAVNQLVLWCKNHGFRLSREKCKLIVFSQQQDCKRTPRTLDVDGAVITDSPEVKFLGIWLDRRFTGKAHVDRLVATCKRRLNVLRALTSPLHGLRTEHLLRLYRGYIRACIDYAAIGLRHAATVHTNKLVAIQSAALRLCLGALPMTTNESISAESHEMPLLLRWQHLLTDTATRNLLVGNPWRLGKMHRRQSTRGSHNKVVSTSLDLDRKLLQRPEEAEAPDGEPAQGIRIDNGAGAIQIDLWANRASQKCWPPRPFWHYSNSHEVSLSLAIKGAKRNVPAEGWRQCALERLYRLGGTTFFTDGSVDQGRERVGGGFHCPSQNYSGNFRLPAFCSIATAELYAIKAALTYALTLGQALVSPLVIGVDSRAVLCQINSLSRNASNPTLLWEVMELVFQIGQLGHFVNFQWLPSHCGIMGNEMADEQARLGLDRPVAEVIGPTVGEAKSLSRTRFLALWQAHWDQACQDSFRHRVDPQITRVPRNGGPRVDQVLQSRLRMGVLKTRSWRAIVLRDEGGDSCEHCGARETMDHILFRCLHYAIQRKELTTSLGGPINHHNLLGLKSTPAGRPFAFRRNLVLAFLRDTGVLERLR